MHSIIRKVNVAFLFLFFTAATGIYCDLSVFSFDQCEKKSCNLEKKMKRHHVLNACLTTAATVYAAYNLWKFFSPDDVVKKDFKDKVELPKITQGTLPWLKNVIIRSGFSLAKVCGQHIFATWLIKQVMPDFSVKSFIKEHISLKEHSVEIRELLKKLSDNNVECRERTFFLIQAHLQKIVCKIECLMVYLLAYSRYNYIKSSEVEDFVRLTCNVVAADVASFNQYSSIDYVHACNTVLSALTNVLNSSITYALCAMPSELS